MLLIFKKLLFSATINITFFLILLVGIQNSSKKAKVNFLINETVKLPISFIIGTSFISGSLLGSLIPFGFFRKSNSSERY